MRRHDDPFWRWLMIATAGALAWGCASKPIEIPPEAAHSLYQMARCETARQESDRKGCPE